MIGSDRYSKTIIAGRQPEIDQMKAIQRSLR